MGKAKAQQRDDLPVTTCSCGQKIVWVKNLDSGKLVCVNWQRHASYRVGHATVSDGKGGQTPVAELVDQTNAEQRLWLSHWTTCPDRQQFKR